VLDLPPDDYEELYIADPHQRSRRKFAKLSIVDVKLRTKSGKIINIEIQLLPIPEMRKRIMFTTTGMLSAQLNESEKYESIKKVVAILITDYTLIKEDKVYHHCYRMYDPDAEIEFTDIIELHTLELSKVPQEKDNTVLWSWMKFLRAQRKEEFDMLSQANPQIQKAVGILMELSADRKRRMLYEDRQKALRDEMSRMDGKLEEGIAIGETKGRAEGRAEEKLEFAKRMLEDGVQINSIAKYTGLSLEEIDRLCR
jgi:predicted transposase/invertase (TIGR01784 family)